MKNIIYRDQKHSDLPPYIIKLLNDKAEMAHIRFLNNKPYVIFNYPITSDEIKPLCIIVDQELTLVYSDAHTLDFDVSQSEFTDIVSAILKRYAAILKTINSDISRYEDHIEDLVDKKSVRDLFDLNRKLIRFQSAINAINDVMGYITQEKVIHLYEATYTYDYANIHIEINQLIQTIVMYEKIIDSIINVSQSLLSNNLSKTMKTLTAITIVISIPTLITSFYGMNLDLPFQDHPYALLIVFLISMIATLAITLYLYRKKLF